MKQIRLIILSMLTLGAINLHARLAEAFAPIGEQQFDIVAEILTHKAADSEDQAAPLDESGWDGYVNQYDAATLRNAEVASTAVHVELPKAWPMGLTKPTAMALSKPVTRALPERSARCHQTGVASWYGGKAGGEKTANGERLNGKALTAANKTLPFGTMVRVTNRQNGRSIVVRINDRGPYISGRIIDLSYAAKSAIGIDGVGAVQLECV